MPTTNLTKKGLMLKRWEPVQSALAATAAGVCMGIANHIKQKALNLGSATTAWLYTPDEDGFVPIASPALAGTFGAGAAVAAGSWSIGSSVGLQGLTATGGTTSTIITNQSLAVDLRGYKVHIMAGPNAGQTLDIVSNTIGATATITVAAQASAFTASTVYRLCTPVWYVIGAGTTASNILKKYDWATNSWVALATTNLPATISTDSALITTPSWQGSAYVSFATGTATAGAASTLTNSGKAWATNQWANYQIRITGGTGAGQIRTIASNTGTVITVGTAWTTQPDATSTYSIEGNDDFIYYMGSAAVGLIRYSITTNAWTVLSPTAARAAAPSTGMSGTWVWGVTDADWTAENSIINGRRIYSLRGGAAASLDYYDLAANTWVSAITYTPSAETFTTGTKYAYYGNFLYIQKDATLRWYRLNFATMEVDGWTTINNVSGAAVVGNTAYVYLYLDGATVIPYVYFLLNTSTLHERQMII
jgi:hypothetical protein